MPRQRSLRASRPAPRRARPAILPRQIGCALDCWPKASSWKTPPPAPSGAAPDPRHFLKTVAECQCPALQLDSTMRESCVSVTRFCFDRGVGMDVAPLVAAPESVPSGAWPNYQIIVPQLLKGAVVPFLGAGASMFHRRLLNTPTLCPPSACELAERFANTAQLPRNSEEYEQIRADLPRAASYFEHVTLDRDGLNDELKSVFDSEFEPNALHHVLARVATRQNQLIITTNYDDMIERAFQRAAVPYHLVVTAIEDCQVKHQEPQGTTLDIVDPQLLKISLKQASIIYKMHGSICRDKLEPDSQFVITEEDYVSFLGRRARTAGDLGTVHDTALSFFRLQFTRLEFSCNAKSSLARRWQIKKILGNPKQTKHN